MRDVRSIVRDMLGSERKEPKPFTPEELGKIKAQQHEEEDRAKKVRAKNAALPEAVRHVPPAEYKVPQHVPRKEGSSSDSSNTAGPRCEFGDNGKHQWRWEKGVKTCWLCEKAAPLDERSSRTSWQSQVYGKKP